ncbi:SGNH/GDSL hydrolase family protein [Azohydromonas lata]|uniref:SGNH/GDSL hydrolase family protein n=1 Tax=Azohydromonas lata TaxID=45677 RepID=A0ABU5IAD6_9BURK|nr:SGNH/GDSL hydrolase family protein [Azohydromonas lata]MDZ5455887.1 SGNH/GDSL hydrolase family protein [Azohydromonas lata]
MAHRRHRALAACLLSLLMAVPAWAQEGSPEAAEHWVGTWSTAMQYPLFPPIRNGFPGQTLRQIVFTSMGGDRVRVRFSNVYGNEPVILGEARIALRSSGPAIEPGSDRLLTFGGKRSVTMAPGAIVASDPIAFKVPARTSLAVSTYFPGYTGAPTLHFRARQTNYVSPPGNFTAAASLPVASTGFCVYQGGRRVCSSPWYFLVGVDVQAAAEVKSIVAFGDSITSGAGSPENANKRWPDFLARRLLNQGMVHGVLNQGMDGNKLWSSWLSENGQSRFGRDALDAPGVRYVIVLMGINDLRGGVDASRVISALQQLASRAKARGLRVYGGTLLPNANAPQSVQEQRQAVNRWIRTGGAFHAVIDFDAALRDPAQPLRLRPLYDSGDSLHPNSAGYQAMGNAIDLSLFRR